MDSASPLRSGGVCLSLPCRFRLLSGLLKQSGPSSAIDGPATNGSDRSTPSTRHFTWGSVGRADAHYGDPPTNPPPSPPPPPPRPPRAAAPPRSPPATMALAAIFVFLLVCAVHVLESMLDLAKKRGSVSDEQLKLRLEISQILKESSALSTPSTFVQAAKLKRLAAAKEKELSKMQQTDIKGKQSLHEKYGKVLMGTKVLVYGLLVLSFWSAPVTTVPKHLLQPFGRMFSWRGVDAATGRVVVGIMPWLFLTSRVSKLLSQKLAPIFLH